jgi:glycosyltransferase involved in cell wall biosynthesis
MSPIRHVLMTADTVGGVFFYALELSRALARHGVRTTLATMGGLLSPVQRRAAASVRGLSIFESTYRLEWMDDPWDDVARAGEWLLALERRVRPDVVHLNGYAHAALDFHAPALLVAHSSILSWFEAVRGEAAPARYERYRSEVARGIGAAAAVIAPTQAMLDAVVRHHGAPARALVIPNAVDPRRYRPARKEAFIVAVGRLWDPAKNIDALSAVAPRLPWPIRVGGSLTPPEQPKVEVPSLEHLGELSRRELESVLGRAAIYALPARYEPFGLSILEAALSGCALVLGDLPSLREIWGGGAALYASPDDPEELEATLLSLIKNPDARAEMGLRARDRALRYLPERMARSYLELYADLDRRSPPGSGPGQPQTKDPKRTTVEEPCA